MEKDIECRREEEVLVTRHAMETVIKRDSPEGGMSRHPNKCELLVHTAAGVAGVGIHRRGRDRAMMNAQENGDGFAKATP